MATKKTTLKNISTKAPKAFSKEATKRKTEKLITEIAELQNKLFAQKKYSILIILQGMDASGKDGVVREVFNGVNPAGCSVYGFKKPTEEEFGHDFLWRVHKQVPEKGMIKIFNRSHYEDILIQRVHSWIDDATVENRIQHINHFEKLLVDTNTIVLKFYLHVSKEEQLKRLQDRLIDPTEFWKSNPQDMEERKLWDKYMIAYEDALTKCNAVEWNIIPADQKWYKNFLIAKTVADALKKLKPEFPKPVKK